MGNVPELCAIRTQTTTCQGACVHQLLSQGIVMTQGHVREQNRQDPCLVRLPPSEEQGEHISRDYVSEFIHFNLCTLQTDSIR